MKDLQLLYLIDRAQRLKHKLEIIGDLKSGKEATVYRVMLDGDLVAMKVYEDPEKRAFQNTGKYLAGKTYKKESERRAVAKGNRFAKKMQQDNWIKREFSILNKLYKLGAKIPKPILQIENAVFMELLGDMEIAAPRLCNVELSVDQAQKAYKQIMENILIFWSVGIIHADLSEYNILWWNNEAYIIDFPQCIDLRTNPNYKEILEKDIQNIVRFFSKYFKIDFNEVMSGFV
ncbi:MAG: hypothetical protein P1P90_01790 [Patescibacteria group bacterium]|nr:hypothetical protein [Patescibacteria group bacterium]